MSDVRWWIVDAVEHRRLIYAEPEPETMEFLGQTVPVVSVRPPADEWVCDFCNASIDIFSDQETALGRMHFPVLVPMLDNNALCAACTQKVLTKEGLSPTDPTAWSDKFCQCDACARALRGLVRWLGWLG